jgi:hypothetical protein
MPYEVTYDPERDCIEARIGGKLSIQVAKEFLAEIVRVVSTSGCWRILEDMRESELMLSIVDLYFAARLAREEKAPPGIRNAIVVPEEDWSRYSFFEMAARNQGQIVKVFTDLDEASRWLMG